MKPYYEKDGITIYNGDCLDVMKEFKDKSFDMVLTDPPYGVGASKGVGGYGVSRTDKHYKDNWDKKRPDKIYFNELLRVSKNAIVFGGNYFADILPQSTHWIVWDKKGEIKFQNPYSDCELLWTNYKKRVVKKIIFKQQGFIKDSKDKRFHPTQKPSELIMQILKLHPAYNVLDPFMGSGTTLVAAKKLGKKAVGIEISKEYCDIAIKRIENIQKPLL